MSRWRRNISRTHLIDEEVDFCNYLRSFLGPWMLKSSKSSSPHTYKIPFVFQLSFWLYLSRPRTNGYANAPILMSFSRLLGVLVRSLGLFVGLTSFLHLSGTLFSRELNNSACVSYFGGSVAVMKKPILHIFGELISFQELSSALS